jgi:hypothetical protein
VARDDEVGDGEDAVASIVDGGEVLGERVLGRAVGVPPEVGEGDDAVGGADQRGDVLGGVAGGADQADRAGQLEALGVAAGPLSLR